MFKATPNLRNAIIRLPLTPKLAGKEYYKGNKVGKLGEIDKYGRFHPDYDKIRTYVYPAKGTKNFELTPFVTAQATPNVQVTQTAYKAPAKRITGENYLQMWKEYGGNDVVEDAYYKDESNTNMPEVWEEKASKP